MPVEVLGLPVDWLIGVWWWLGVIGRWRWWCYCCLCDSFWERVTSRFCQMGCGLAGAQRHLFKENECVKTHKRKLFFFFFLSENTWHWTTKAKWAGVPVESEGKTPCNTGFLKLSHNGRCLIALLNKVKFCILNGKRLYPTHYSDIRRNTDK